MPVLEWSTDVVLLALRLAMLVVLYLFLLNVFLLTRRELGRQVRAAGGASGHLIVLQSGQSSLTPGQIIALRPLTTLGRSPGCTVVLDDTFVSTTHAALTWRAGQWWLRDAGSTNGTLLNERPVAGEMPVAPNDVIGIGQTRLRLAA